MEEQSETKTYQEQLLELAPVQLSMVEVSEPQIWHVAVWDIPITLAQFEALSDV